MTQDMLSKKESVAIERPTNLREKAQDPTWTQDRLNEERYEAWFLAASVGIHFNSIDLLPESDVICHKVQP